MTNQGASYQPNMNNTRTHSIASKEDDQDKFLSAQHVSNHDRAYTTQEHITDSLKIPGPQNDATEQDDSPSLL